MPHPTYADIAATLDKIRNHITAQISDTIVNQLSEVLNQLKNLPSFKKDKAFVNDINKQLTLLNLIQASPDKTKEDLDFMCQKTKTLMVFEQVKQMQHSFKLGFFKQSRTEGPMSSSFEPKKPSPK